MVPCPVSVIDLERKYYHYGKHDCSRCEEYSFLSHCHILTSTIAGPHRLGTLEIVTVSTSILFSSMSMSSSPSLSMSIFWRRFRNARSAESSASYVPVK